MIGQADSDRAVSPVIGVVLMVAIAVILAATIAAMTGGIVDDVAQTKPIVDADSSVNSDWVGDGVDTPTDELVYVSHVNGDNVSMNDVRVVVRDEDGATVGSVDGGSFGGDLSSDAVAVDAAGDSHFDTGSTLTVLVDRADLDPSSNDEFQIQVTDTATGTTLHDGTHNLPDNSP